MQTIILEIVLWDEDGKDGLISKIGNDVRVLSVKDISE